MQSAVLFLIIIFPLRYVKLQFVDDFVFRSLNNFKVKFKVF